MSDQRLLPAESASTTSLAPIDTQALMQLAVQGGEAGAGALERLVALQERMEDRAAKRAFQSAMADLQSEIRPIPHTKQQTGGARSTYTEIDAIVDYMRPFWRRHGFSYTFNSLEPSEGKIRVVCKVSHRDGHSEETSFEATIDKSARGMNDQQKDAATWSYARRYALIGAFGIVTCKADGRSHDTDGADEQGPAPVSLEQAQQIESLLSARGGGPESRAAFLKWVQTQCSVAVSEIREIPQSFYEKAIAALRGKRKE